MRFVRKYDGDALTSADGAGGLFLTAFEADEADYVIRLLMQFVIVPA